MSCYGPNIFQNELGINASGRFKRGRLMSTGLTRSSICTRVMWRATSDRMTNGMNVVKNEETF
ncbi:MAG: hypothetical protein ACKESB_03105 [Candidatus Hodgkinia cicadicola]